MKQDITPLAKSLIILKSLPLSHNDDLDLMLFENGLPSIYDAEHAPNHQKVAALRQAGMSAQAITEYLDLSIHTVYMYNKTNKRKATAPVPTPEIEQPEELPEGVFRATPNRYHLYEKMGWLVDRETGLVDRR